MSNITEKFEKLEAALIRAERELAESRAYAEEITKALQPFAELGRPFNPKTPAFHDLPADTVLFSNSAVAITVAHIRAIHAALANHQPKEKS